MYSKLIVAAVLITFVCVQLAHSLNCYHCDGPISCGKPSTVACSRDTANRTRNNLNQYFLNVANITSDNFDCFNANYTANSKVLMTTAGCVYREQYPCQLKIRPDVGATWFLKNCTQCSGNLCNKTNLAGTYSTSSYTIIASILTVVVAKIIAH